MRIEDNSTGSKAFYKEMINIALNKNNLAAAPEKKLTDFFRSYLFMTCIGGVLLILMVLLGFVKGFDTLVIIGLVITALDVIIGTLLLINMNRSKTRIMNSTKNAALIMDDDGVEVEYSESRHRIKWSGVAFVRVCSESIVFFPKDCTADLMIVAQIKHKTEIMGFLKDNHIQIKKIGQ